MEAFLPVIILLVTAIGLSAGIYTASTILKPRAIYPNAVKLTPFECGVPVEGGAHQPFKSRFYLIAVLFLLFDVEGAFFLPWALVYRESLAAGPALLVAILFYLFFLVLGLVYIYQKNCLELS